MKNVIARFCACLLLVGVLHQNAFAQLQALDDDDPSAILMSRLVETLLGGDAEAAGNFLLLHAHHDADADVLEQEIREVAEIVHAEPGATVAGIFRHPPTGDAVAMIDSESGLRLYVALQATDDMRIARVHLPVGGWQDPPPPPLVEDAIPGLLDLHSASESVAFVNVSLIPMDAERVVPGQTVLVEDGRIVRVGPSDELVLPPGVRQIDGAGRYLMPGLTEMHAHIPSPQQGAGALERTLFLFLANGVTTIRGMLGHPSHLDLRTQAVANEILSPRIYTSSPSINGNSAPTPDAGRTLVEEHAAAGYDFLKIHPGLSRATYDAVVEAADRAGIQWAGHVPANVGLYRALEAGQTTIDHLDSYLEALAGHGDGYTQEASGWFGLNMIDDVDPGRITELARRTRAAGVWNVPTQSLMEHLLSPDDAEEMILWPEMRYMPAQTLRQWANYKPNLLAQLDSPEQAARYLEIRRALILALHREGAGLLLGADAPQLFNVPGFSVHRELQFLVDAGLSPYEALATGTRLPAAYLDTADWGTIGEGRSADLVLLRANPLEDVANARMISGVMVRGTWLPQEEIERRLEAIEAALAD